MRPGWSGGTSLVEQPLDLGAEGLQHFTLLGDRDGLEDFQVRGMDREERDELFEAFGHAAVEGGELLKVLPNLGLLLLGLAEQAFGDDVGHVLADDADLSRTGP